MNVSLAAVITAHLLVFGKEIEKNQPFVTAAANIRKERADWKKVMTACDDLRSMNQKYSYSQLAAMAAHRLGGAELLNLRLRQIRALESFSDFDDAALLREIATEFDALHPYGYCKKYDLLINGSGEEFALQFMSAFNAQNYQRY
jgi:hypothetical protein